MGWEKSVNNDRDNKMIIIRINENVRIDLSEPTIECYDELVKNPFFTEVKGKKERAELRERVVKKLENKDYQVK